jgi:hypothetical protein
LTAVSRHRGAKEIFEGDVFLSATINGAGVRRVFDGFARAFKCDPFVARRL